MSRGRSASSRAATRGRPAFRQIADLALGGALVQNRDADGAIKALREATRLQPDRFASAQALLSNLYLASGEMAGGRGACERRAAYGA